MNWPIKWVSEKEFKKEWPTKDQVKSGEFHPNYEEIGNIVGPAYISAQYRAFIEEAGRAEGKNDGNDN
jgi:uncharacterized protein YqjF (DUF2071 family)